MLKLIDNFLSNRFQQILLNDQTSDWLRVNAGVTQGSILGPLFFLIYINDLPDNLVSSVNRGEFAEDTSRFSTAHGTDASRITLKNDLKKISEWTYKWKMQFNPDLNKQAQEIIFSRKTAHSSIHFNDASVAKGSVQNHLDLFLSQTLNFNYYIKEKLAKSMR